MSDRPVRSRPKDIATPADIDDELRAQVEHRERRRREEKRKERPRQTYDLPQELIDAITAISEQESVSRSDLATWALAEFVIKYRAGDIDLEPHREFSKSLRYNWTLELPEFLSFD